MNGMYAPYHNLTITILMLTLTLLIALLLYYIN
jgi:hypothetical protein